MTLGTLLGIIAAAAAVAKLAWEVWLVYGPEPARAPAPRPKAPPRKPAVATAPLLRSRPWWDDPVGLASACFQALRPLGAVRVASVRLEYSRSYLFEIGLADGAKLGVRIGDTELADRMRLGGDRRVVAQFVCDRLEEAIVQHSTGGLTLSDITELGEPAQAFLFSPAGVVSL